MRLPKNCKIELIASKDDTRHRIQNILLTGEHLVATNGMALVKVPITRDEGDTDGLLAPEHFQAARKQAKRTSYLFMEANGSVKLGDGTQMPRPDVESIPFPDYRQCIPPEDRDNKFSVGLNAKLLWELAQAMDCEEVTLHMEDSLTSIIVKPGNKSPGMPSPVPDAFGVLMPCRLS